MREQQENILSKFKEFWDKYIRDLEKEEVVDLFPDSFTNTFPFHGRFSFFVDLSNNRVFNMCGFEETLGYKEETWNVDHLLFSDFIHPDHLIHFYSIIRSTLEFDFSKYKHNPVSIHFKLMVKSKSGEYLKFFVSSGPTLVAKSNGAFAGGYYECTLVHGMADSFNFGWDITGDPELVQSFKESMKKRMSVLLTKRELEVLQYLKEGLSSKMIADKLGIAKNTVDNFRSSLLKKSSAGNTAQLISVAQKNGWI